MHKFQSLKNKTISSNTAILIFARSARLDAQEKRFSNAIPLFEALNTHTLNTVKKTKLPYYLSSEEDQEGTSFGARFTREIEKIYALGYENVITIGNDSPHLTANHILEAHHRLEKTPIVLGPSQDGGFYLMGLNKSHFNTEAFLKLPWQTASLSVNIIRLLNSKKIEAQLLETLCDLDAYSDIHLILEEGLPLPHALHKILKATIRKTSVQIKNIPLFLDAFSFRSYFNKASPGHSFAA